MKHRTLNPRRAIDSCTYQLHSWRPFQFQSLTKTLDSDHSNTKPYSSSPSRAHGVLSKRPCLSDRTTTFSIDNIDMSRLTLIEDEKSSVAPNRREKFRWFARKRRRRGSRSVSGRSSDRSGTRRCGSVGGASAAHATCSDFLVAAGTDSSGELFLNGDSNWSSDVSEARNSRRKDRKDNGGGGGEKENLVYGSWQMGGFDNQGNESGYGSEPGYRGDAEFGDEFDEEEDDGRILFWGERSRDTDCSMEMVEENTFTGQRAHSRCRRKKHDMRMVDAPT